jgi:hypothetical protein
MSSLPLQSFQVSQIEYKNNKKFPSQPHRQIRPARIGGISAARDPYCDVKYGINRIRECIRAVVGYSPIHANNVSERRSVSQYVRNLPPARIGPRYIQHVGVGGCN